MNNITVLDFLAAQREVERYHEMMGTNSRLKGHTYKDKKERQLAADAAVRSMKLCVRF